MLTCKAVIPGDCSYLLGKREAEGPVELQLGGSDVAEMAQAAAIGAEWGYDEINLNVGCPSDRVKAGRFGACLMAEPRLVRDVVTGMRGAGGTMKTVRPGLLPDGRPPECRPPDGRPRMAGPRITGPQQRGSVSHRQDPVSPGDQVAFTADQRIAALEHVRRRQGVAGRHLQSTEDR